MDNNENNFKKKEISSQETINQLFKKNQQKKVLAKFFFYENDIPFNVTWNKEFKNMLDSISNYGSWFKSSSYREIKVFGGRC